MKTKRFNPEKLGFKKVMGGLYVGHGMRVEKVGSKWNYIQPQRRETDAPIVLLEFKTLQALLKYFVDVEWASIESVEYYAHTANGHFAGNFDSKKEAEIAAGIGGRVSSEKVWG